MPFIPDSMIATKIMQGPIHMSTGIIEYWWAKLASQSENRKWTLVSYRFTFFT